MSGSLFRYLDGDQAALMKERVFNLLSEHGIRLDHHPELFDLLAKAGIQGDTQTGMVTLPRKVLQELLASAPTSFSLGARNPEKSLPLPRPDGSFFGRTAGGCHGWIDPESGQYEKVTTQKFAQWAHLINHLDEINLLSMLFCNDAPVQTADIYSLSVLLKNTDKSIWIQPYSSESVPFLIALAEAVAGGRKELKENPIISTIVNAFTPRAFKSSDIEAMMHSARAGVPIQACSLPGAGGTSPVTMPGTVLQTTAEILAITAMAQVVQPGAPVVACPIIFSTDMRTGRSLQSSVESMRGASLAVQFIKTSFGLPTHDYGSGCDSPIIDEQGVAERSILITWMAASGLDILGGAGQLEVATTASPLQLIMDNEILAMARRMVAPFTVDDEQLGWEALSEVGPGEHFLTSMHTLSHCRDGFTPQNFIRMARDEWETKSGKTLMERIRDDHRRIMALDNPVGATPELVQEIDAIVQSADKKLIG